MIGAGAPSSRRTTALVIAADLALFLVVLLAMEGLRFPIRRDELHYWPTVLSFSHHFPPALEELRSYDELNTPLPFVVFGLIEHLFHGGIVVARAINLGLCLACLLLIQFEGSGPTRRSLLASVGLLLCPYFIGVGIHLYTEMWTITFVLLGMRCYLTNRFAAASLLLALAVSCRQYAIAFPLALLAERIVEALRGRARPWVSWAPPLVGLAMLGAWIALFGGLAPAAAIARRFDGTLPTVSLFPQHVAYFVACVGAYYVIPELAFFAAARASFREALKRPSARWLAVGMVVAFCAFPPLRNPLGYTYPEMGYLDKALRWLLGDAPRMAVLASLAALAMVRFSRWERVSLVTFANAGLMLKAGIGWDKYALPLLVVLWWIQAREGPA